MAIADELLVVVRANTAQAMTSLGAVEGKIGSLAGTTSAAMGRIGTALTTGLTLPLAGIATVGIKSFMDFDQAMSESLAIMTGDTEQWRGKMEEAALSVARTTTLSATQAAESFYYLLSAGLDAEQSIAALPAVARFAQAGVMDMATATSYATNSLSALGLKVPDAAQNLANLTRVTDVFTLAAVASDASIEEFAAAMTNQAGPALRAVGKDIEEGTAVLAVMADQGIKGEEAGTKLTMVMRDLQTAAISNKDEFVKYGIAVYDSNGEMRNMADIVGDLETGLAGMSDEQKKATLLALGFTDRSVSVVQALLGTSDAMRAYEARLREASGYTEQVATNQMESFRNRWVLIKHAIQEVAMGIGRALLPGLTRLGEKMVPIIEKVSEWVAANQELIPKLLGIAGALGPVVLLVSKLGTLFTMLTSPIGIFLLAVAGIIALLNHLGVSVQDVVNFFTPLLQVFMDLGRYLGFALIDGDSYNDWLTHLPGPLQGVAQAFGELLASWRDWWEKGKALFEQVKEFFERHWDEIQSLLQTFWEVFSAIWTDIWEFLGPMIQKIVDFAMLLFGQLFEWFDENFPLIQQTIERILGIIKGVWDLFWPAIKATFETVWAVMAPIVETLFGLVLDVITFLMAVFNGDWSKAWEAIKGIVSGVWNAIHGIVFGAIETVRNIIGIGLGFIRGAWDTIWNVIAGIVKGVWGGIKTTIQGGVNAAITALEWLMRRSAEVLNHIIQAWNNANLFLNFADIPKLSTNFSLPRVSLGDGGPVMSNSIARVGERGRPETVFLPAGSRVDSGQGSGQLIGQLIIHSNAHPVDIARELGWELIRRG